MTTNRKNTAILTILVSAILVFTLSSCSGLLGGYDGLEVRVSGLTQARNINPLANSGYIVLMKENKVFSLNVIEDAPWAAFSTGSTARIPQIPAGNYVLGVVLMNDSGTDDFSDDTNYGLAIKEIEITKGYNSTVVDVGPGLTGLVVGITDFSDFMTPDGYSVSFEEDTINIHTDVAGAINLTYLGGNGPTTGSGNEFTFTSSETSDTTGLAYSLTIRRVN